MAASSGSETRALKHYIADAFNNAGPTIVDGTRWQKVAAYAQRPKMQKLGSTVLVTVANVERVTSRIGMGRPVGGLKRHAYQVEVMLEATDRDAQGGGDDFDQVMDQSEIAIETLVIGATISDPGSNQQYRLTKIGEEIHSRTLDPTLTADQSEVTFLGNKTFEVWIQYNG